MRETIKYLQKLVSTPSQVGVNDLGQVVLVVSRWLQEHSVSHELIGPAKKPLAVVINPPEHDDEVFLLNACLDTAPVGDLTQWKESPFSGNIKDGWLYGRGSADSKAAIAVFSELARTTKLKSDRKDSVYRRRVSFVFDCDEHSGRFGGIRAYTTRFGFPKYCAIGYPGLREIVSGSRGFYRTTIALRGVLGHAGSGTVPRELATTKLMILLRELAGLTSSESGSIDFPLGPRASATWIRTGVKSYSVNPSRIECGVDIRLTPTFDPNRASEFIESTLQKIASETGNDHPSTVSKPNCWPAYKTPDDALLPRLFSDAAARELGNKPPFTISGPSNIGNFLAMHGSQVISGFGVNYKRIHGPDECIEIKSLPLVFGVYRDAIKSFLEGQHT